MDRQIYRGKCPACKQTIEYDDNMIMEVIEPYESNGLYKYGYVRCPKCKAKLVAGKIKVADIPRR